MQLIPRILSRSHVRSAQICKVLPVFTILLALWSLLPVRVQATSDPLDPAFGDGGKVLTDFSGFNDFPGAVTTQPDGKVVMVGTSSGANFSNFAVARYNTDGTPDSTFGNGGQVRTVSPDVPAHPSNYLEATAVALQPDHKIVVAGNDRLGFALARYNADGTLDASFGTAGIVFNYNYDAGRRVTDVAILPDGKIMAAGWYNGILDEQGYPQIGVALSRYNADGTLDATFGAGGKINSDSFGRWHSFINRAVIQPNGQVVFAGYYNTDTGYNFVLARYNADGAPDSTFGTGGRVNTLFANTVSYSLAVAVQPDKKIVVVGDSLGSGGYNFGVARYDTDGTLDSTFGTGGKATTDLGSTGDFPGTVAIQPDGKIVVAGQTYTDVERSYDFAAVRYNADGTPDSTFGIDGKAITDFSNGSEFASASTIQSDGKIILAGYHVSETDSGPNYDFALTRYTGGAIDLTPPTINCPGDITASSEPYQCATIVDLGVVTAIDNAGRSLTPVGLRSDGLALNEPYAVGTTTITWMATDNNGNTASCFQVVTVIDQTPPVISGVSVSPAVLSPPNRKMVDVTVSYDATDNCGLSFSVTNTLSVTSNEPDSGGGRGSTGPDWEVVDTHHVLLRAERASNGRERLYTITITSMDGSGNASSRQVTVSVLDNRP